MDVSMSKDEKHWTKKWEVSLIALENDVGKRYKVTRKIVELGVSETRLFRSKKDAQDLFNEWLE
jgi:hypothetical protein